jgi:hypothetical protein
MPNQFEKSEDMVPVSGRQLTAVGATSGQMPAIFLRSESASRRFWEFFTVNIRNRNTRRAYFIAVSQFSNPRQSFYVAFLAREAQKF